MLFSSGIHGHGVSMTGVMIIQKLDAIAHYCGLVKAENGNDKNHNDDALNHKFCTTEFLWALLLRSSDLCLMSVG